MNKIKPLQTFVRQQPPAGRLLLMAVCFVVAAVAVLVFFGRYDIRLSGFGDGAGALFRFFLIQMGWIVAIAFLLFAIFVVIVPAMLAWGGWISTPDQKIFAPKLFIFTRVPDADIRPPQFLSNF